MPGNTHRETRTHKHTHAHAHTHTHTRTHKHQDSLARGHQLDRRSARRACAGKEAQYRKHVAWRLGDRSVIITYLPPCARCFPGQHSSTLLCAARPTQTPVVWDCSSCRTSCQPAAVVGTRSTLAIRTSSARPRRLLRSHGTYRVGIRN